MVAFHHLLHQTKKSCQSRRFGNKGAVLQDLKILFSHGEFVIDRLTLRMGTSKFRFLGKVIETFFTCIAGNKPVIIYAVANHVLDRRPAIGFSTQKVFHQPVHCAFQSGLQPAPVAIISSKLSVWLTIRSTGSVRAQTLRSLLESASGLRPHSLRKDSFQSAMSCKGRELNSNCPGRQCAATVLCLSVPRPN
jgi:hypothetical protein